ncbi:hypothetical protein [uncultured Bradyrhizobium sp.]|uniref:hypothetical protein n=1 Tax=uncultured Bradyrhizobium sp. TaxID=199684 RepID=UPI0035C99F85
MAFTEIWTDSAKAALARAFDAAWDRFISAEGIAAATDDNRKRLAARIVALAKSGEADENALSEAGFIHIRVLAEAARLGAHNRSGAAPGNAGPADSAGAHAYTPETVAAMSTALELCLDTLPLRIPSDALRFLSASILDDASRGERDPERLRRHALDALKARH